ncbi:MAG TPA: C25 family cysteine peptidase [Williamwhitmania sp.]|nr:C25 family cysteine peptidase [Williamwhitmania sp.]
MKNLLPSAITAIIIAAILTISAATAYAQPNRAKAMLVKSTSTSVVATFKSPLPRSISVETPRGTSNVYFIDGAANILTKGMPALPKLTKSIIVPTNAHVELVITDSTYKDIPNVMVAPSKGNISRDQDPAKVPFIYGAAYSKNQFFPGNLAEVGQSYTLRKYNGVPIVVYPIQYNPVTKVLRVYTSITVEARFTSSNPILAMASQPQQSASDGFRDIYKTQFLNYTEAVSDRYTPLSDVGTMLVVCYHDFMSVMQPFVDWKNQRGLKTVLVDFSTIGTTADQLKTYVSNYYHQNGLTFLLLVGDSPQIPSKQLPLITTTGTGYSDSYYGMIDGDDAYPEVIVGRFSAENATQVTTMVNRSISYEKSLKEDATWLSSGVGIASAEGGTDGDNGESDAQHMENIRTKLMAFGYSPVTQVYDPNASKGTLISRINEGTGIINYVGHGADTYWVTTGFGSSDMSSLTNTDRWPFIFDVACVNGNFVGQTCFAEAFTRASTANGPTGTVDIIGSTINQSWAPPMDGQDEMVNILTESYSDNIRRTYGGIVVNGCMAMNDKYGSDGDEITDFWAIFGDPSLLVRTKAPSKPYVSHQAVMIVGQQSMDITTDANNATVSLWQAGSSLATTTTANETATLTFNPLVTTEPVILTLTGYNLVTTIDTLPVTVGNEPYITIKSITPVANMALGAERRLNLSLKNISTNAEPITNATIKLRSTDSRITLVDSTETVASIGLDQVDLSSAFSVLVNANLPDLSQIKFSVVIEGTFDGGVYYTIAPFTMQVTTPFIKTTNLTVDDSYGNKNGNLDPGEFGIGSITIKNTGHSVAQSPSVLFSSSDSTQLIILSPAIPIGNMNVGDEQTIPVKLSSPASATEGAKLQLYTNATCSNQQSSRDTTNLLLGAQSYLTMKNGIYQVCNTKLFDSGGPSNNYSALENYTMTLTTGDPSTRLKLNFLSFVTSASDVMTIYDGPSNSYPVLGTYSGTVGAFEVTSSSSFLTISFMSGNTGMAGWDANIQCFAPTSLPTCPSIVSPLIGATNQREPVLQWSGKNSDYYKIYWGTSNTPALYDTTSSTSMQVRLMPNTSYYWKAVGVNQAGESIGCPVWNYTTGSKSDSLIMKNGMAYSCNAVFYDEGGPNNDYNNNTLDTYTIYPSQPGAMVKATFSNFAVEDGYDTLYVWNGASSDSPLIGAFSTIGSLPLALQNMVANNSSGALTFRLSSDYYVTEAGWKATIGCNLPSTTAIATLHITDGTNPIPNASVTVGALKYSTDGNGNLSVTLPYGINTIGINADGYRTNNFGWNISTSMADTTVVLNELSILSLTVTNSEDAHPVYPALVTVDGVSYNTNIGGLVDAPVLGFPAGWAVSSNGFQNAMGTTNSATSRASESVALTPINHVQIKLQNSVTDEPISTGTVFLGPEQSLSGLDGIAHFIAASGSYDVEASAPGYQTTNLSSKDINSSNASSISISMMPNQYNLTIIVIDTNTSAPLVNAAVAINGQTYYSDATGTMVITLYPGNHAFTVSADNYDVYSGSVTLEGADKSITVLLKGVSVNGNNTFSIFPNPATDEFTVDTGKDGKILVTVFNLVGAAVIEEMVDNGTSINISSLHKGVYIVKVTSEGEQHVSKLIVN